MSLLLGGGGAGPGRGSRTVLEVDDLRVEFPTDDGPLAAVDHLSFELHRNEVLGVVGESGSGKSVTAMAILGLLPRRARVTGSVRVGGMELVGATERDLNTVRGNEIAIVFQDALAALNPVYRVGDQIAEAIRVHQRGLDRSAVHQRVVELLDLVGIPQPQDRAEQFPHEYSGGMRQRAMIAMALANDPAILIADEPTTALDVTIQAQVLDVLERIQERTETAIMLITHDLGVVAGMADRVLVMYAGREVELGPVDEIFYDTGHPYTLSLLGSLPRLDRRAPGERLFRIKGSPPSLLAVPPGCPFHPRCFQAEVPAPCATDRPELRPVRGSLGHVAACHFSERLAGLSPDALQAGMTT
jgi:oligopeptide/dipeptide ABC transporter ATP-binding protein